MILIGIKQTHAGGTFNSINGLECFNVSGSQFTIIKEGELSELTDYVKTMRDGEEEASIGLSKLNDNIEFSTMSEEEYEKERDSFEKKLILKKFDKLLMLEGFTI
jgi:hypothetical protein